MEQVVFHLIGPRYADAREIVNLCAHTLAQGATTLLSLDMALGAQALQTQLHYRERQITLAGVIQSVLSPSRAYAAFLRHPGLLVCVLSISQDLWAHNQHHMQAVRAASDSIGIPFAPLLVLLNDRWGPDFKGRPIVPAMIRSWFPPNTPIIETTVCRDQTQVAPLLDCLIGAAEQQKR